MKRIYIKNEIIVIENYNEGDLKNIHELVTMDDVEFAVCCGEIQLENNMVYEVQEGYLLYTWDDYLLEFDYILTKK